MSQNPLNAPWSLHFDRDGTEDVAVIRDSSGEDLATSRHFWRPEGDDPTPPTLAAMRAMKAAPKLLEACKTLVEWVEAYAEEQGLSWGPVHQTRAAIAEATDDSIGRAA